MSDESSLSEADDLAVRAETLWRASAFAQALACLEPLIAADPRVRRARYLVLDACAHLGLSTTGVRLVRRIAAAAPPAERAQILSEAVRVLGPRIGLDPGPHDACANVEGRRTRAVHLAAERAATQGMAAGVDALHEAFTTPDFYLDLFGDDPDWPLADYWRRGQPLPGRLIVRGRGGAGDTLQWLRYLRPLLAAGVRLTALDDRVDRIALDPNTDDRARAAVLDAFGAPEPGRQMWTEPFALLTALFPVLGYFASTSGYLRAEPTARTRELARQIASASAGARRVGIVWSNNESELFAARSATLAQIIPLLVAPNVHWVVAQRGPQRQALLDLGLGAAMTVLPDDLALHETGAVLAGLDAMISNDTATAHLAAAQGVPTWTMLPEPADWRWESDPDRTVWYPCMRLVRQSVLGDWSGVVRRLEATLRYDLKGSPNPARP